MFAANSMHKTVRSAFEGVIFLPFLKQKPKITVNISKAAAPSPIRPFMINGAAKHLIKPYPSPTAANESIISHLENTAFWGPSAE